MAASPSTSKSNTAANPSAQDSVWGWQQNSDSIGGLGRFLFENHHLSDVVLHCGGTPGAQIKAHKLILAAKSPVFEQMFLGDKKSADAMDVCYVDEDKDILEVLLKLIYGFDHTLLLTIDNVFHVIRVAEKYKVHAAFVSCESWIGSNMNATNCLVWLEAAQLFPVNYISNFSSAEIIVRESPTLSALTEEKCWMYVDKSAVEILRSPKFLTINHSLLMEILKRNSLHVNEYAVYEAALKWADRASVRYFVSSTQRHKRAALGEALYHIRFTLMSAKEFGEGPAQSGILLPDEVSSIFLYMVTDKKLPIKFVTEPRIVVASGTFEVERFPATYGKREYVYEGNVLDSVSFTVDRNITLVGCGIYTSGKEPHEVDIKVFTGANKVLRHQECYDIAATPSTSTKLLTGPACIVMYEFDERLLIPRSTLCTIQCGILGRDTDFGINGKEEANAKVTLDNGNSVMYRFTFVPGPANEQNSVRSLTSRGQIPTIIFRP